MHASGRVGECAAARRAHALLRSPQEPDRIGGALFALSTNLYGEFPACIAILKPVFTALQNDFVICHLVALGAWTTNEPELCERASRRCIALEPHRVEGYLRLGLLAISQEQFADAFFALSDGVRACPDQVESLRSWRHLAERRMQGIESVKLTFDGVEFVFELATYNGHAAEASACFLAGTLCEPEELQFARRWVGPCETYVEVGSSVGNHAVYFGKTLKPRNLFIFDANATAVRQTDRNLARNGAEPRGHPSRRAPRDGGPALQP